MKPCPHSRVSRVSQGMHLPCPYPDCHAGVHGNVLTVPVMSMTVRYGMPVGPSVPIAREDRYERSRTSCGHIEHYWWTYIPPKDAP